MKIRKLRFDEDGIKEEEKTHRDGAFFCRGYNVAIDDIVRLIFK